LPEPDEDHDMLFRPRVPDEVPARMPVLSRGAHRRPEQGACLMEYTALLTGERFSDQPACTHRALAELARQVNDRVSSRTRPGLVTRAPSLAAVGPGRIGVSAAVADAVLVAHWQYAPGWLLLPWRSRRTATLRARDVPGRGWWGRRRDVVVSYALVHDGLDCIVRTVTDPEVRDQILVGVLDRALSACTPGAAAPSSCPVEMAASSA
jgi:hypothetical protein